MANPIYPTLVSGKGDNLRQQQPASGNCCRTERQGPFFEMTWRGIPEAMGALRGMAGGSARPVHVVFDPLA